MFTYTEHFLEGKITAKIGTNCLIRRSSNSDDILLFLLKHGDLMKITSDTLTKLLQTHGESVRKNLSKANKIRQILKMEHVKNGLSHDKIELVLAQLEDMEKRNKKRKSMGEAPAQNDEASRITQYF